MPTALATLACCVLALVALPGSAVAAFSGQNGRIAFVRGPGASTNVFTMNADGGGLSPLTNDAGFKNDPRWSSDGRRLVLERGGGVFTIAADGGGGRLLSAPGPVEYGPAWSPDGARIAFQSNREGDDFEIYTMTADGGGITRLTMREGEDNSPAWSPDGSRIAWVRDNAEIWTLRPDGGGATQLTTGVSPDWSPDGSRIAFARDSGIWTIKADGTGATQLTDGSGPAWSPDGSRIAFSTRRDGNDEIYTMTAQGGGFARLTNDVESDYSPDWQPLRAAGAGSPVPGGGSTGTGGGPTGTAPAPAPAPTPRAPSPPNPAPRTPPRRRLVTIRSPIETLWGASRSSTRVIRMVVKSVPAGSTVQVRCDGGGCPFARKAKRVRRRSGRVALHGLFGRASLRRGTVVEIRVTRPGAVGKVNRYIVRARLRLPREEKLCLSPGARRPAKRCR